MWGRLIAICILWTVSRFRKAERTLGTVRILAEDFRKISKAKIRSWPSRVALKVMNESRPSHTPFAHVFYQRNRSFSQRNDSLGVPVRARPDRKMLPPDVLPVQRAL